MITAGPDTYPLSDLTLARRLERAEGQSCAAFAETRARLFPASGACWIEVAGASAVYDGVASPVTQTFGLGMFQPATASDLERIEAFFRERGAPVFHEVSPLADPAVLARLNERGYQPFEFSSVLFRPVQGGLPRQQARNDKIQVRQVQEGDRDLWAHTAAQGWAESNEAALIEELGQVSSRTPGMVLFFAELEGRPIATGALSLRDGVALLAGASTIPQGRRQGAQLALLEARLRHAAEHDCDLAMMGALPGSASQRNAERQGFRIAYTRTKWRLSSR
jgi:GNAT superfamily N-acetyltransferase